MIVRAKKNDAQICVKLLSLAMGEIANFISGYESEVETVRVLEDFFRSEQNRLSYENMLVKKINGQIVGVVCFYQAKKALNLDDALNLHLANLGKNYRLEPECYGDGVYIDSVATDERCRGQGIATELFTQIYKITKEMGEDKVTLVVDDKKSQVRAFYERLGFEFEREIWLYGEKFNYMVKQI